MVDTKEAEISIFPSVVNSGSLDSGCIVTPEAPTVNIVCYGHVQLYHYSVLRVSVKTG